MFTGAKWIDRYVIFAKDIHEDHIQLDNHYVTWRDRQLTGASINAIHIMTASNHHGVFPYVFIDSERMKLADFRFGTFWKTDEYFCDFMLKGPRNFTIAQERLGIRAMGWVFDTGE